MAVGMTARVALGAALVAMGCAGLATPMAGADPIEPTTEPTTEVTTEDATEAATDEATEDATEPTEDATTEPAAPAAVASDGCTGQDMLKTISSVTANFAEYLEEHPDANGALIDITRQPAFVAMGQMDGYFNDHPDQANDLRAIQAPLVEFKNRCGLQVAPTDALAVLADV